MQGITYSGRSIDTSEPAAIPAALVRDGAFALLLPASSAGRERFWQASDKGAPYLYAYAQEARSFDEQLLRLGRAWRVAPQAIFAICACRPSAVPPMMPDCGSSGSRV